MAQGSFNHFGKIAKAIKPSSSKVVRKVAFDAQGNIQGHIVSDDLVDTAFMFNSVYVVTHDESTYKGGEKALPEVEKPSSDTEAYVAVAAEYAVHQNYGTVYLPPHSFFERGMEDTRPGFEQAMRIIAQQMEGAAQ